MYSNVIWPAAIQLEVARPGCLHLDPFNEIRMPIICSHGLSKRHDEMDRKPG